MVTIGAYVELEAVLENGYTPSFEQKPTTRKPFAKPPLMEQTLSLSKNDFHHVSPILEEAPVAPRRNLMGLHKASSIENRPEERPITAFNRPSVTSTRNKEWDAPIPDFDIRPATRNDRLSPQPLL